VSLAQFIADQRTNYWMPHGFKCRVLEVSEASPCEKLSNQTRDLNLLIEAARKQLRSPKSRGSIERPHQRPGQVGGQVQSAATVGLDAHFVVARPRVDHERVLSGCSRCSTSVVDARLAYLVGLPVQRGQHTHRDQVGQ